MYNITIRLVSLILPTSVTPIGQVPFNFKIGQIINLLSQAEWNYIAWCQSMALMTCFCKTLNDQSERHRLYLDHTYQDSLNLIL